jgi:hypothetical protein
MPSDEFGIEVLQGMVMEAIHRLRLLRQQQQQRDDAAAAAAAAGGGGGGGGGGGVGGGAVVVVDELLAALDVVVWPWDLPQELPFLTLT